MGFYVSEEIGVNSWDRAGAIVPGAQVPGETI